MLARLPAFLSRRKPHAFPSSADAAAAAEAASAAVAALDDDGLAATTEALRARLADGEPLASLLPAAFAAVREASGRATGQRHYACQLRAGAVLARGAVAEMRTGEGKTLSAMLAAYLHAIPGRGVHVVTANGYLASRDAALANRVLAQLGCSVGLVSEGMHDVDRRAAYAADVTYATHSEIGFDHLRDGLRADPSERVCPDRAVAIVDEVDLVLIDEARTPLVISGVAGAASPLCAVADAVAAALLPGDVEVDEKGGTAHLTETGCSRAEELLAAHLDGITLFDGRAAPTLQHLQQAVAARSLKVRDRDYAVVGDEVVLIDGATGRPQPGRRFTDGLHAAIEAKEGVEVRPETTTLASITYQNLFRCYDVLAGTTGTAATEADEFASTYKLDVEVVPTNRPSLRVDHPDEIYATSTERMSALAQEIAAASARRQPVLVGTASVVRSEEVSAALVAAGWRRVDPADRAAADEVRAAVLAGRPPLAFVVLNASNHALEAGVVADAGLPGAVTISTNMAGRGTDIVLGGSPRRDPGVADADGPPVPSHDDLRRIAVEAGGLYVVGTERHESRRIDDQLRGRSGRQGDPGATRFLLSLDDDLMRVFGSQRLAPLLSRLGLPPGAPISHPWITRSVDKAQQRVEKVHAEARRTTLKYDDVVDGQRRAVAALRLRASEPSTAPAVLDEMVACALEDAVAALDDGLPPHDWDAVAVAAALSPTFGPLPGLAGALAASDDATALAAALLPDVDAAVAARRGAAGDRSERLAVLSAIDLAWRSHAEALDHLRRSVGWAGLAQRDPVAEFRAEGFAMFERMLSLMRAEATSRFLVPTVPQS